MQSFKILPEFTNIDYLDPGTLRMKQEGRNNFAISGSMTIARSLSPKDKVIKLSILKIFHSKIDISLIWMKVKMTYERKLPNGRFLKMFVTNYPACEMMKQDMYKKVTEKSNLPYPPVCPFPPVCNDQSSSHFLH